MMDIKTKELFDQLSYNQMETFRALIEAATRDDTPKQEISSLTNCPNCGAPITSCKCEYCGTVFNGVKTAIGYPVYDNDTGKYISHLLDWDLITVNEARTMMLDKAKQLQEQATMQQIYQDAINTMRSYRGVI